MRGVKMFQKPLSAFRKSLPAKRVDVYAYCSGCRLWQTFVPHQQHVNGTWTRCVNCKHIKWVDHVTWGDA